MTEAPVPRRARAGLRPAVWVAAVGSAMAGGVHAAAARNHEGDLLLTRMFVATAIAQAAIGLVLMLRPRRWVLMAGLGVNGGAVAVWALTRTVGIGAVDVLATVEDVGTQDLGAAAFAVMAVVGAFVALVRPAAETRLRMSWAAVTASMALVAALPAITAEHTHAHGDGDEHAHVDGEAHAGDEHGHAEGEDHAAGDHAAGDHADGEDHAAGDHADGEDHAAGDHAAGDHAGDEHAHVEGVDHGTDEHAHDDLSGGDHGDDHGDDGHPPSTPGGGGHEHPPAGEEPPGDGGHGHPTDPPAADDPITALEDPRLTQGQWDAAVALIGGTIVGLRPFVTEADVVGAGYVSMGDGGSPGQYTHFVKWSYLSDPYELDPAHVESIVMKMNADGSTRVVAGMYILSLGDTLWQAPDIAGELTSWHDHGGVCRDGDVLLALSPAGGCPSGVPFKAPPMLHVWVEANSCGPFTAIVEGGADCGAIHH